MSAHDLPIKANITIYRGDDLERLFSVWYRRADGTAEVLDTTGWTGRMQVRPDYDSPVVLVEATTANGRLTTGRRVVGAHTICLEMHIPGSALGADRIPAGFRGVYDIELTNTAGKSKTFYKGIFRVDGDVTR